MGISSHLGIVLLVIVGLAAIIGVIIIAMIETKRTDNEKPSASPIAPQTPADKKKR
jgi:hypothetical protein